MERMTDDDRRRFNDELRQMEEIKLEEKDVLMVSIKTVSYTHLSSFFSTLTVTLVTLLQIISMHLTFHFYEKLI